MRGIIDGHQKKQHRNNKNVANETQCWWLELEVGITLRGARPGVNLAVLSTCINQSRTHLSTTAICIGAYLITPLRAQGRGNVLGNHEVQCHWQAPGNQARLGQQVARRYVAASRSNQDQLVLLLPGMRV